MSIGLIPLLITALLLVSGDAGVDTAELVLSGTHDVDSHRGALIVGDAEVTIPDGASVPGPIIVIGGELSVHGAVTGDVIQLAGTVVLHAGASTGGELRHVAGTQIVSPAAETSRRTSFDVLPAEQGPVGTSAPAVLVTAALALLGAHLARRRRRALDTVADAVADHPLVALTVGALLTVTAVSLFVFMAFTLVLIPVALLGVVAGLATAACGIIAWGHLLGRALRTSRAGTATGSGVVAVMVLIHLLGLVPLVGDLIVIGMLVSGLGAVVITYVGLAAFEPPALPG